MWVLFSNDYWRLYYGIVTGLLIGGLIIVSMNYADQVRVRSLLFLALGVLAVSLVSSSHADYVITGGLRIIPGTSTEQCSTLSIGYINNGGFSPATPQKTCVGLTTRIYKDITEQDPSNDYYLLDMRVWALNGTNGACFIYAEGGFGWGCGSGYAISATGLGSETIGISIPNSIWGDNPGSGCSNTQSTITPSFAGATVNILLPAMCTTWNSSPVYNWNIYIPSTSACWSGTTCNPNIFANNGQYADFYVEITVGESLSFTASFTSSITLSYCSNCPSGQASQTWNLSGSLFVDPSNYIGILPNPLQEVCMQGSTGNVCYTEAFGTSIASNVYVQMADNVPETWSLSVQDCPSGWTCALQSSSVSVPAGQTVSDQLYISAPYGQAIGWQSVTVTGTSKNHGSQLTSVYVDYLYAVGGGGGCTGCHYV